MSCPVDPPAAKVEADPEWFDNETRAKECPKCGARLFAIWVWNKPSGWYHRCTKAKGA